MNPEKCITLHNRLFDIGLAGAGNNPPEPVPQQSWFAFHGDNAEAVRGRLSQPLVAFLEHAWAGDENEHAFFYYASGLSYPGSMWSTHAMQNEEAGNPDRFLTLYAATDVAEHPEGVVFDQETNLAIVQMSIHDASITHNGRQTWYPLEDVLHAWLDMVASDKVEAVTDDVEPSNGKFDPWILHLYSEQQVDETVQAFNSLVEAIESRMPPSLEEPNAVNRQTVMQNITESLPTDRQPLLSAEAMDAARLPNGFARAFLGRCLRPHFWFIAPGLEVPTAESFPSQPFLSSADSQEDEEEDDEDVVNIPPILLFRATTLFDSNSLQVAHGSRKLEPPFSWPYSDQSRYLSGLYLTETDRESGTDYEDGGKLVLPFGIGSRGFARTADGARFGENKEATGPETDVEAHDTFADLYQPGYVPFGEQHEARLAHILQAWRKQVESGQWSVGPEGVIGGMDKWREADTENGSQGYVIPVSW